MISTALPNDAFSKPDSVWPSLRESCSVAVPRSYSGIISTFLMQGPCCTLTAARGMIAMKLKLKRRAASQFKKCEHMLSGMKSRRIFNHDPKMKNFQEAR